MSYRSERYFTFPNVNQDNYFVEKTETEIKNLFHEILNHGVHGFCFSLYEEGQRPGDVVSEEQIIRRMNILKPHTQWVRSFSCTEGNEMIPKVAKKLGIKTLVGAWLGNDKEKNKIELDTLIELAHQGYVDIAAVGNEVLYRKDLTEEELLENIQYVKNALPNIPVSYVDAYYEFSLRPNITALCDVILCNCYPYWEGTPFEYAINHMKQMYYQTKAVANGKQVIITETGWPSQGENLKGAFPSKENALHYFLQTQLWAKQENIEIHYFSSFDESWKIGAEGEVGAYWGIWDKNEQLKY